MLEQLLKRGMSPDEELLGFLKFLNETGTDNIYSHVVEEKTKTFLEIDLECQLAGEETRRKKLLGAVHAFIHENKNLKEKIDTLGKGLGAARGTSQKRGEKIGNLTRERKVMKLKLEGKEKRLSEVCKENSHFRTTIIKLIGDKTALQKDLTSSVEKNAEFTSVINEVLGLLENIKDGSESAHQQLFENIEAILKDSLTVEKNDVSSNTVDAEPKNASIGEDQLSCHNNSPNPHERKSNDNSLAKKWELSDHNI